MYEVDDKVTQRCVLSRPWIKSQFHDLGVDHIAAGVPNGSWEHFNDSRFLHWTQICRQHYSRTKPCLTTIQLDSRHDCIIMISYEVAWYHMHATWWQDQEFSWCFYRLMLNMGKQKKEPNTRCSSIKHVSIAFRPASGSWTAPLEQVKRWLMVTAHSCGSHKGQACLKIRHPKISCVFDQYWSAFHFLLETAI